MRAFSIAGSKHFVSGFNGGAIAPSGVGLLNYLQSNFRRTTDLVEGSTEFDEYRSLLLRETDRSLFLAGSCFVRSVESLRPSSSSWAVVGLYYSSFHAAHAILGMLGCWFRYGNRWVEVVDSNPGGQKIRFQMSNYPGPRGSHKLFWVAYYAAVSNLTNWVPSAALHGVTPMSASESWFIDLRNRVNYKPMQAFGMIQHFERDFDPTDIPNCFPGELSSAFTVAQAFLEAAKSIAASSGLKTDVFAPSRNRASAIRAKINGARKKELAEFSRTTRVLAEF